YVTGVQTCALPISISALPGDADTPTDRVELFDLDRKRKTGGWILKTQRRPGEEMHWSAGAEALTVRFPERGTVLGYGLTDGKVRDRKSTRLNSSHVEISYAVFCLKKKIKKQISENPEYIMYLHLSDYHTICILT